jgi:hypothetical protein
MIAAMQELMGKESASKQELRIPHTLRGLRLKTKRLPP